VFAVAVGVSSLILVNHWPTDVVAVTASGVAVWWCRRVSLVRG